MAKQAHLQAILSAVNRISPVLAKVSGDVAKTKGVIGALNTINFAAAQRRLGMLHKTFRDVGSAARNSLAGLGLPATVGLGAAAFGFVSAARGALEYAGALQDASDNTGMAMGVMQQYQAAFMAGGVAAEDFTGAVTKLNKGMAEASAGKDKTLAALFTKLRIPLRDARGQIRNVADVLPELSDAFEKNTNPAVRARIAMELFGKSGAKLLAVLGKGGKSMAEARAEAQRLGAVLSDLAIQGPVIDKFGKRAGGLDDLGDSLGMLGQQARVQIAEAFGKAAPALNLATQSLQEWIAANKDLIQQNLGGYIERAAIAFKGWVDSGGMERLGQQLERIVSGIGSFVDAMGGMRNVLIGLGVLVLAGPVASLFSLGFALARLGAVIIPMVIGAVGKLGLLVGVFARIRNAVAAMVLVFALNPAMLAFTVAAVAIAGVGYLIYRNWSTIGPMLAGVWASVSAGAAAFWERTKALFNSGIALVNGLLQAWDPLSFISAAWDRVLDYFRGLWERIRPLIEPILNAVGSAARFMGGMVPNYAAPAPVGAVGFAGQTPLARAGGLGAPGARVQGEMRVRFENAPPGMRVEPGVTNTPGLGLDSQVDYGRRGGGIG